MKVTCPSCSTAYRVPDRKVPDRGAQIRCTKCGTLFKVSKSQPEHTPVPDSSEHGQAIHLEVLSGEHTPHNSVHSAPRPEAGPKVNDSDESTGQDQLSAGGPSDPDGAAVQPSGRGSARKVNRARGISAIRAQSGVRPKVQENLQDAYRVRIPGGITYNFSTQRAMLLWLEQKGDLGGCQVAGPVGEWIPAESLFRQKKPAIPAEVRADAPPRASIPDKPVAESLPVPAGYGGWLTTKTNLLLWTAVVLTALLVLFVAAVTLTRYGVLDLSRYLPLEAVGIEFPLEPSPAQRTGLSQAPHEESPETVYQKALDEGRRAIKAKQFSKAALEFSRALSIYPGSVEALEGLAEAYYGLGDGDRATATLKKARPAGSEVDKNLQPQ